MELSQHPGATDDGALLSPVGDQLPDHPDPSALITTTRPVEQEHAQHISISQPDRLPSLADGLARFQLQPVRLTNR